MSHYAIISQQIGNGFIGKVYKIQCLESPNIQLIIKVFNSKDIKYYNIEKEILLKFINTDYIIKLRTYEIILNNSPVLGYDSRYLLFDYLEHGNLYQYLQYMNSFDQISEEYVKSFCDKLLKALKKIHGNNICHNRLDISNILLDNEFNPVIIHFTEAFYVDKNNNHFRKDFVGLANILAMLMTQGYFLHCKYNKSEKYFEITDSAKKKCKDSTFWNRVNQAMHIPQAFIKFFNALIKTKNINIDDLYNLEWLAELKNINYLNEIENKTKIYFQKRYQNLFKLKQEDSYAIVDYNSILNEPINNNNSLFCNDLDRGESKNDENHDNINIKKIEIEPKGIVFDYIEIITDNINNQNSNIPYNFMTQYQDILNNSLSIKIEIESSTEYLSFTINFGENNNDKKNEEDKANKNEEFDECNRNDEEKNDSIDDDYLRIIDDEGSIENLIINVEFLEYNKNNNSDIYNDKYYLMFNRIQGEICDYYFYLKQLKEKAKQLLKQVINNE